MKSWTACINYRARRKDARRIGKKNERERESGRDGVGSAAGQGRANGISGQFSWAESRNRGCIFTGVLIWLETYYDRACNAALGARVIWYICFAYRIAREAVPEEESAVVAGDERNDGGGEKESEKVCSNTNVFAFHNKLRTHGTTTTARHRNRRGWVSMVFACIYSSGARPIMPVYCETLSSFAPYEFTLPNVRPFLHRTIDEWIFSSSRFTPIVSFL